MREKQHVTFREITIYKTTARVVSKREGNDRVPFGRISVTGAAAVVSGRLDAFGRGQLSSVVSS